jgi:hypothetical protein
MHLLTLVTTSSLAFALVSARSTNDGTCDIKEKDRSFNTAFENALDSTSHDEEIDGITLAKLDGKHKRLSGVRKRFIRKIFSGKLKLSKKTLQKADANYRRILENPEVMKVCLREINMSSESCRISTVQSLGLFH